MSDAPIRRLVAAITIVALSLATIASAPPCTAHDAARAAAADAGSTRGHESHASHAHGASDQPSNAEVDAGARAPVQASVPMPCGGPCAPTSCVTHHGIAARGDEARDAEWGLVAAGAPHAAVIGAPGPARAPEPPPPRG